MFDRMKLLDLEQLQIREQLKNMKKDFRNLNRRVNLIEWQRNTIQ